MDMAQNILVIKTVSGYSNGGGIALDALHISSIVGCIAVMILFLYCNQKIRRQYRYGKVK